MEHSFLRVQSAPDPAARPLSEKCGFACVLMSRSKSHRRTSMQYVQTVIEPAVQQENIRFYFNDDGEIVGYVVWAFLSDEVQARFMRTAQMNLHVCEWNEGSNLWIVDFLVPYGNLKYVLRDLRDELFAHEQRISYYRINKGGKMVVKSLSRADRLSFFGHFRNRSGGPGANEGNGRAL